MNFNINVYISFLEIYNENAYDLLDKKHLETPMENWNKIQIFEDEGGNTVTKNLLI